MERPTPQEVHVSFFHSSFPLAKRTSELDANLSLAVRNFGIVRHPGSGSTNITVNQLEVSTEGLDGTSESSKKGVFAKKDSSTAQEQLTKKGFSVITWHGKCEADKVSMGTYDVDHGNGGMFGLIFDNTFSKQTSKTATFVLLTYPTDAPPQTARNLPNLQAGSNASNSKTSLPKLAASPNLRPTAAESVDSFSSQTTRARATSNVRSEASGPTSSGNYHTGVLLKRRRKKGQGFARRFFSLDYATCTLSYYHNRNSSALRGAVPLSLAAIAADETRREISIDSGAEVWHLKASNDKEFTEWARALEKASRIARGLEPMFLEPPPVKRQVTRRSMQAPPNTQQEEDREWQQVEALVSRVVGTRDALRRLVKDVAVQKHTQPHRPISSHISPAGSPVPEEGGDYFTPLPERKSFWKRKSSASATSLALQASTSSALAVPSPSNVTPTMPPNGTPKDDKRRSKGYHFDEERTMNDHCRALLGDLDAVVGEFSNLLSNSKRRRMPAPLSAVSRNSMESSTSTDEFFDAEEAGDRSQLLLIDHHSEEGTPAASEVDEAEIHDDSSVSSSAGDDDGTHVEDQTDKFPSKPKSLAPLPITDAIKRRKTIAPSTVQPPSLIAFVRKNVGKDLSTISMPVSANEPTSALHRVAEQLEYANLLDTATKKHRPEERMLYVAAFAVSQFSGSRAKERAVRKPFNPLLGETYELVRGENEVPGGLRLIVEKVVHRPVRLAMQADSALWSFAQSPAPSQKFWGKSAELTTDGRVRIVLRLPDGSDERYSWNIATMFLRNVVMGEKYIEPVGDMTITNEGTGAKAVVEFRSKGMFGGRGEDVQIETYGGDGVHTGLTLAGTWTGSLRMVEAGKAAGDEIWRVGALVDNAASTYGMTTFAASLNEVTAVEKDKLPPTDTRLRQDQRLAEDGKLDDAELWKVKLEEAQRTRRKQLEDKGVEHSPRWFAKVATGGDGEEVWKLKGGKDNYWEQREKGQWTGVVDIFNV